MTTKRRARLITVATVVVAGFAVIAPPVAEGAPETKVVTYGGYRVTVPRSWPVHRLADEPERCVRFDRHAVYLGRPGQNQDCPPSTAGKVEALLIEPLDAAAHGRLEPEAVVVADEDRL